MILLFGGAHEHSKTLTLRVLSLLMAGAVCACDPAGPDDPAAPPRYSQSPPASTDEPRPSFEPSMGRSSEAVAEVLNDRQTDAAVEAPAEEVCAEAGVEAAAAEPTDAAAEAPTDGVSREAVDALLGRLFATFAPEAAAHGARLRIDITPGSSPNAFSDTSPGGSWLITMREGLFSSPKITQNVLAVILCHEVGHLLGGFPFNYAPSDDIALHRTAESMEGQADYYAGKECLARLWASDTQANAAFPAQVPAEVRAACSAAWSSQTERDLCARIAHAARGLGAWLAARHGTREPDLTTPDPEISSETLKGYASDQCRVDTVFQGALCPVRFGQGEIPGLTQFGAYTAESEARAAAHSCLSGPGARPTCWFKPNDPHFDCVGAGLAIPVCSEQDGQSGYRSCEPRSGVTFTACSFDSRCISRGSDGAWCQFPDEVDPFED